ncbi:MAG: hypothetical protein ACLFS0_07800 [Bacteroidales bacterium]
MRFFMGMGAVLFLLGIGLFVYDTWFIAEEKESWVKVNYITLAFQGVVAWWVGLNTIRNEKYFVEWDDEVIRWWLPRRKEIETIRIKDILSVEKKDNLMINLGLKDAQKTFSLKFFFYPERKLIVDKFEAIGQSLDA